MSVPFFLLLIGLSALAQTGDITGKWKTIDDNSGQARSVVEIYKQGNEYFGKVSEIFPLPGQDPDPICVACEDERKDQKVIGMEIIKGMEQKEGEFSGGEILDPESGNIYDCKMWLEDGNLMVRGYLYFFYRTQTWLPFE